MRGPQITTRRQQASRSYEESWNKQNREANKLAAAERGERVVRRNASRRNLRCPDVLQALERAAAATGDPVFDDALRALRAYGFNSGGIERTAKLAERDIFGNFNIEYLRQMRWLLERSEKVERRKRAKPRLL